MGFFQDRAADIKDAVDQGAPEHAAGLIVHSMLEGPGSAGDNLADLTDAVQADKS
ncbi:hypothetical protein [Streptomyces sp. NPDC004042]|uniref:hypothetical protein n=1 Tax=Streptomyces sp. NPDC004042 TaxID=3154451 RepID=UPI0033AA8968